MSIFKFNSKTFGISAYVAAVLRFLALSTIIIVLIFTAIAGQGSISEGQVFDSPTLDTAFDILIFLTAGFFILTITISTAYTTYGLAKLGSILDNNFLEFSCYARIVLDVITILGLGSSMIPIVNIFTYPLTCCILFPLGFIISTFQGVGSLIIFDKTQNTVFLLLGLLFIVAGFFQISMFLIPIGWIVSMLLYVLIGWIMTQRMWE